MLVNQGLLIKNFVFVGTPDKRFPLSHFLEDFFNKKMYTGRLWIKNSIWYFSDKNSTVKKIESQDIQSFLVDLIPGELIIFTGNELPEKIVSSLIKFCRENSIGFSLVPDIKQLSLEGLWKREFRYLPVIERWERHRDSVTWISIKKIFDLILIAISLPLVIPISLIITLLIKLEDGGPILYITKRVGKYGRTIKFYKFRSMIVGADRFQKKLFKYNKREDGPLFKMDCDPRTTQLGKILRKYSLDEIPQLINVLKGELAIVGPRPHLKSEVAAYSGKDILRLECFPGITCLPQVYGRNTLGFREWMDLDLIYRKKWSISMDMKILLKSLIVVLMPFLSK